VVVLVVVFFLMGIGLSALWFHQTGTGSSNGSSTGSTAPALTLNQNSRAVLAQIKSPVEIRFYSLLDPATIPAVMKDFSGRVNQLVSAYELEGNGKIKLVRLAESSDANAVDAAKHGIKVFNLEKGEACYFGIAVASGDKTEALAKLDPEWESALEFDLARAISHVITVPPPAPQSPANTAIQLAIREEVKKAVPNVETVSLEEGTRILRDAAVAEFAAAVKEMENQVKQAQESMKQAQTPAEQEVAMKRVREVQLEQADKLKEIAAKSQARIQELQALKNSSR
jgi:hypothetical protein